MMLVDQSFSNLERTGQKTQNNTLEKLFQTSEYKSEIDVNARPKTPEKGSSLLNSERTPQKSEKNVFKQLEIRMENGYDRARPKAPEVAG